jgi:4'-phosphopantetheinyl transferase
VHLAVTYACFAGLALPADRELAHSGFPVALRQRIQRFRRPEDRLARMAAYGLLHEALVSAGLGEAPLLALQWDGRGRPFLHAAGSLDFNLSHSGEVAVCAVAWGGRVGVDVERMRDVGHTGFERFFPKPEWSRIAENDHPRRAFFESWTRLESVAKGEGFGLGGPLQEIEFERNLARLHGRQWTLSPIGVGEGYCCHTAAWPAPAAMTVRQKRLTAHASVMAVAAAEEREGIFAHG